MVCPPSSEEDDQQKNRPEHPRPRSLIDQNQTYWAALGERTLVRDQNSEPSPSKQLVTCRVWTYMQHAGQDSAPHQMSSQKNESCFKLKSKPKEQRTTPFQVCAGTCELQKSCWMTGLQVKMAPLCPTIPAPVSRSLAGRQQEGREPDSTHQKGAPDPVTT